MTPVFFFSNIYFVGSIMLKIVHRAVVVILVYSDHSGTLISDMLLFVQSKGQSSINKLIF